MKRLVSTCRIAVLALALSVPISAASAPIQFVPIPPGTYEWYDDTVRVGYMIVECDGSRHGPYGWITIDEVFTPLNC